MKRTFPFVLAAALALGLGGCGVFKKTAPKSLIAGERLPVLNFEARLVADPALTGLEVTLPPAASNSEWTQPGGNAAKSMGHLQLGATLTRAWSVSIGKGSTGTTKLNAGPVIAGGRVFTIDSEAVVRAFDAKSGGALWSSKINALGKKKRGLAFGGGVSTDGQRVYAATGYGIAEALDAASGRELWRADFGTPLRGAPSVGDNRVFLMSQDNQMFAVSADKGVRSWDATGTVEVAGLLAIGAPAIAQDTVVVGFSSGELNALRVENGRTVWQDALARTGRSTALAALSDIDASPVVDRGRVFAVGHGGRMAALELSTGQRAWELTLAGVSTPWVAGDYVFVVTLDAQLVCVTRTDGKIRWISQLPRWKNPGGKKGPISWSGPILAGDRLILVGSNKRMITVSPYKGDVLSEVELAGAAQLVPAVADGTLYVLTDDGKLTAYR